MHHHRMLTAVSVVALLAVGANGADGRQSEPTARVDAAQHAATMLALARHRADSDPIPGNCPLPARRPF